MKINIAGISKAKALFALYNASQYQGMGINQKCEVTLEICELVLERCLSIDYLYGKVIKVDLSGDTINPWSFDRDLGEGACFRALQPLGATLVH